jgi:hypothetical protein
MALAQTLFSGVSLAAALACLRPRRGEPVSPHRISEFIKKCLCSGKGKGRDVEINRHGTGLFYTDAKFLFLLSNYCFIGPTISILDLS